MRHSLPLLAALLLPASARAAKAPAAAPAPGAWSADYAKGPWDALIVRDRGGKSRELWVNLQDAGKKTVLSRADKARYRTDRDWVWDGWKDSGSAPLYELVETSRGPNPRGQGIHIVYASRRTAFTLALGKDGGKVLEKGAAGWSQTPTPEHFFQAPGTYLVVSAPTAVHHPRPRPRRRPRKPTGTPVAKRPARRPAKSPPPVPAPAPAPATAPLSLAESKWLTFSDYSDYTAALKAAADAAAREGVEKDARAKAAADLRPGDRAGYEALLSPKPDSAKIDAFLKPIPLYGQKDPYEIALKPEERAALKSLKDAQGLSLDAAYDAAMKTVNKDDFVLAHRVTEEYRAKVPAKTPGGVSQGPEGTPGAKTPPPDAGPTLESIIRAHLGKDDLAAFERDLAGAKTDADKQAVLDRWLGKVGPQLALSDFGNDHSLLVSACRTLMTPAPAAAPAKKSSGPDTKALDQLKATNQCGSDPACNAAHLNGATAGGGTVVAAPSGANLDPDLKAACEAALAPAAPPSQTQPGGDGGLTASVPGLDVDPNAPAASSPGAISKWIAKHKADIRTGIVGGFLGMMVGSFFGPVGIGLGILIGAAGLIGLKKLAP